MKGPQNGTTCIRPCDLVRPGLDNRDVVMRLRTVAIINLLYRAGGHRFGCRKSTNVDLHMIDAVITQVANPHRPYGLRGVSQTPIIPTVAASFNTTTMPRE